MIESTASSIPQPGKNEASPERFIERGSPEFFWANVALFAGGFATFALLYCVQPIMPLFSKEFGLSPATSSLSLSVATQALAVSMLVAGAISEVWGRKPAMAVSMVSASLLIIACAFAPNWHTFLFLRFLTGLAFSGLPATAMAYIGEEMHGDVAGLAMGLYIGGTGLGATIGRLLVSSLADWIGWRAGLFGLGLVALAAGAVFWIKLPPSRHFHSHPFSLGPLLRSAGLHLRNPVLLMLFAEGFLLLGAFMAFYNYLSYRLMAPPFGFSQTAVGFLFALSFVGIVTAGHTSDRASRLGRALSLRLLILIMMAGSLLSLLSNLAAILFSAALLTYAFYGAHAVASSWISRCAKTAKAQAASLYLFCYYTGSSLVGWGGGWAWSGHGWPGVITLVGVLLSLGLLLAFLPREETR